MRHAIIGATGFVGGALARHLEGLGEDIQRLSRPEFDLRHPETFAAADTARSCILDCAACIDGTEEEIRAVNVDGFALFLNHCDAAPPAQYVYFSTSSTLSDRHIGESAYVRSKRDAEKLVLARPWGRVVRLSFPFGIGENPERLVSRLIRKALAGERLVLGDVVLPLTPIGFLAARLPAILDSCQHEVNFTDGRLYHLRDVAESIFTALGLPGAWDDDPECQADLSVIDPSLHPNDIDALELVRGMCVLARDAAILDTRPA
jgi:nucleoside-diphosphate-sugar epimerase